MTYFGHESLKVSSNEGVISKNSSHDHSGGQGHLGHVIPHWIRLVIVDGLLLNGGGGKFFIEIMISLEIKELQPKIGFWQVSNTKSKPPRFLHGKQTKPEI